MCVGVCRCVCECVSVCVCVGVCVPLILELYFTYTLMHKSSLTAEALDLSSMSNYVRKQKRRRHPKVTFLKCRFH